MIPLAISTDMHQEANPVVHVSLFFSSFHGKSSYCMHIIFLLLQVNTTSTLDQNRGANICHGGVPVNVCLTLCAPNLLFYMFAPDLLANICL